MSLGGLILTRKLLSNMWWIYIIPLLLLLIIIFITYSILRTRCPYCGTVAIHKKDKKAIEEQKKGNKLSKDILGKRMTKRLTGNKSSYVIKPFICKKCGHKFDREKSMYWWEISQKYGDDFAVMEYGKLLMETPK